ncbi:MAG TPA: YbaB/EbfC family nucleoid-associated protein [Pseudonocardiaceae bacterium]|jgi:DNA-binding protein YbaB
MTTSTNIEDWLGQYKDKIGGIQQAAAELQENLASTGVTLSSPDGSVTVSIGPGGGLRDLKFGHRASEHTHAELAALVMKTVGKAQRQMSEKVMEVFEPLGAGTNAMEMLTNLAPEEDPEEELPTNAYDELAADAPAEPAHPVAPQPVAQQQPPAPPAFTPPPVRQAPPAAAARPRPARPAVDDDEFDERPW